MNDDSDNRKHVRHPLTGDLGGSLVSAGGSAVPCVAVDVSASGMRVVSGIDLENGARMTLNIGTRKIQLEVVWCVKDKERKGRFSSGLRRLVETDNLELAFVELGLIAS